MRRIAVLLLSLSACARRGPPVAIAVEAAAPPPSASAVASAAAEAAEPAADSASAPALARDAAPVPPRVYVRFRSVPVHAESSLKGDWIGMLTAGDSVALRSDPPVSSRACPSARAVEPRGWVCVDGEAATLDATDAIYRALRAHAPDYASPLPYLYGESRGTRRQRAVPGIAGPPWPAGVFDPRAEVAPRSTVAWTDDVEAAGKTWLRTSDMSFVPKDRVVPFDRATFHGVALGAEAKLPLAFFKRSPHTKYRRGPRNRLVSTDATWPRLAWVGLTGQSEKQGGLTFWETLEPGVWIDARGAAVIAPQPVADRPHGAWIEVAALQGWVVAWENDTAVYATMVSAGKLGAAKPDPDHEPHQAAATTPIGTFRIQEKLVTATLQSDLDDGTDFVHADVPWSQRFYDKYLLHTAYWHDEWGEGHSGGCVNLSPADARWLFDWSEPHVPDGWHAVRAGSAKADQGSVVVVHP
jgi:hypothetical protein